MALLFLCLQQGIEVGCAHVNYHHRPEADEEEAYLRSFCKDHGIPFYVRDEPFVYEGNFEAAAREWRYSFFCRIVKEYGYQGVLIAHQQDDLIETYLMQEERNLVPEYYGLKAEMMYQGMLVERPLLGYTKKELKDLCQAHGIRYYIDSTNESEEYSRNRIRKEVGPMDAFTRNMVLQEIRSKNAVLQERRCRVGTLIQDRSVSLSSYRKMEEEDRVTLLRMAIDPEKKLSLANLKQLDQVVLKHDDFLQKAGSRLLAEKDGRFFAMEEPAPYAETARSLEELRNLSGKWFRVLPGEPGVNAVSVKESDFPVTIRNAHEGDEISMRFGTKKVNRFFIDRKIPKCERLIWPVLVNREGSVILVPGLGCDVQHYTAEPQVNVIKYFIIDGRRPDES